MIRLTREELVSLLTKAGISVSQWGRGEAKTIDHLLEEVNAGEAQLRVCGKSLERLLRTVGVYVLYRLNGQDLVLKEDLQVLVDGRERRRSMETSLGEKLLPGERPEDAAHRTLLEELGFTERLSVKHLGAFYKTEESRSYPGLVTHYEVIVFEVSLPEHLFQEEGYVVSDGGKTHYFVWQSPPLVH